MDDVTLDYNKKLIELFESNKDSVFSYMILKFREKINLKRKMNKNIDENKCKKAEEIAIMLLDKNKGETLKQLSKPCFELIEEYKESLKEELEKNDNIHLTHITNVSFNNLENKTLRKSKDRLTQFEEEKIDAVFSSSESLEGNPYLIRTNNNGMILIDEKTYLLGLDNVTVEKNKVMLEKSGYIYTLNSEKFEPVVTIKNNEESLPNFVFDNEWIAKKDLDKKDILSVEEYKDVTNVIENNQIYCRKTDDSIDIDLLKDKLERERLERNGIIRNINKEAGINCSKYIENSER